MPPTLCDWRAKPNAKAKREATPVNASRDDGVRKPDAGNPPVRFDEGRGWRRSLALCLSSRATPPTLHLPGFAWIYPTPKPLFAAQIRTLHPPAFNLVSAQTDAVFIPFFDNLIPPSPTTAGCWWLVQERGELLQDNWRWAWAINRDARPPD